MAFCNSCGATLGPGAKFCNKCGAAVVAGPSAGAPAPTPLAAAGPTPLSPTEGQKGGGSSALKIVLIVVAVIVGIGVLGLATLGIIAYKVARGTHVQQQGDQVKVETPFGTVQTSKDPDQAAKDLGVDIYPGAEAQKTGAASANFGPVHTASANFETSDSVDKVCGFYKSKFPAASVKTSDENHCTIVSSDQKNMVTINIQASGNTTTFQITSVSKKSSSSN